MGRIEDKIDLYLNENPAAPFKRYTYYDDGEECTYKNKNDLILKLAKKYKDTTRKDLIEIVNQIIDNNKGDDKSYIGQHPYYYEIDKQMKVLGVFNTQKAFETERDASIDEI